MPCSTAVSSKLEREKQLVAGELSLSGGTYSGLAVVMWLIRRIMGLLMPALCCQVLLPWVRYVRSNSSKVVLVYKIVDL